MDLHYIVDKLNDPPFQYGLSLLSMSEKSSQELLQILSNVFAQISPKHQNIDVSKEDPDQTAERLVQFLKIIKYRPPATLDPSVFRQLLAAGEKDIIYMVLKWVLPQPAELQKRAFVGYYLSFPDLPEELNYDGDVMELKEEIKIMQQQFIELHKASEGVKSLTANTSDMKKKIKQLEEEKERLGDKVAKAKSQVDKIADKSNYMDVCSALRKQQDEEVNLSTQMQDQKKKLEKSEGSLHKVNARMRELSSSYQDGSASKLLETVAEDVGGLRSQVNERYPKELERRQKRAQALQEALSNGVNTEIDLQRLQGQVNTLHGQIQEINDRRAAADKAKQGDKAFLQLRQAQQMATMVTRKKEEMASKLERLQEKKTILSSQFEKLTTDGNGMAVVSEEEWRQKYESMKSALPQYKKMKKELGDIEAEVFVLAYTEELLMEQEGALNSILKQTARKHGVAGFTDVASDLENVSAQKSAIDEIKGMTLNEISKTVEEINSSINERKVRLAPQIKKLRSVRQQFTEFEAKHSAAKQNYDAAMSQYESKVSTLERNVNTLKTEVTENEAKFHLLHCQLAVTDQNIKRVSGGPASDRLEAKFTTRLNESESQAKILKDKNREIKESHTTGLSQIDMMTDLLKLLQIKVDLQKTEMGIPIGRPTAPVNIRSSGGGAPMGGASSVGGSLMTPPPMRAPMGGGGSMMGGAVGLGSLRGPGGAVGPLGGMGPKGGGANVMTF